MRPKDTLLMRYVDGEVTPAERRQVEELLRSSPEARAEVAELRRSRSGDAARGARRPRRQRFEGLADRALRAAREASRPAGSSCSEFAFTPGCARRRCGRPRPPRR